MKKWCFLLAGLVSIGAALSARGVINFSQGAQAAARPITADVGDLEEVAERDDPPRHNRRTQQADGKVYALPATVLIPEAERLPPPVFAISGVRGQDIREGVPFPGEAVDIIIELPEGVTFSRGVLEGTDVADWIPNLPQGLEAQAHGVKKGASSIKIYISGTPAETRRELIRVTVPGTFLSSGSSREFISPDEEASYNSWLEGETAEAPAQ